MSGVDDLAELLARGGTDPRSSASDLRGEPELGFHQGRVVDWDQVTGTNRVEVAGTILADLPALNISDMVIVGPGDLVGILRFRSTFFILGRIVQPNSDQFGNATLGFAAAATSAFNFAMTTTETTKASVTLAVPTWADEAVVSASVHLTAQNTTGAIAFGYVSPYIAGTGGHQIFTEFPAGGWAEVSSTWQRVLSAPLGPTLVVQCRANSLGANWTAQPENTALVSAQVVFRRVS